MRANGVHVSSIAPGFVRTPATDTNEFPMPFIIEADAAAKRIADGLARHKTHIAFPKRFTWLLRLINLLPRSVYVKLVGKVTSPNR